jgi:pyruvate ferredoxin oxidoreductase delta subunit
MGQLFAVEIIYRGVFQKILAKNICRGIVLSAHNEGKPGLSFGRYSDSPERNGIPAKSYAIVATDDETLEAGMAQYSPKQVDISVVLDDTLCKGVESWAWMGLQAVNHFLKPNATLAVISNETATTLLKSIHIKDQPYKLGTLKGIPSFSGMWNFKDDHTDVRVLGVIAKAVPQLFSFSALEKYIAAKLKDGALKVKSAKLAYERFTTVEVKAGTGNSEPLRQYVQPKWEEMREGATIAGMPQGGPIHDQVTGDVGGHRPVRSETFFKFSSRTLRPVTNFESCTKCTLCWLNCPDAAIDVTPDGLYDIDLEACCGCGVCEQVCPVSNCITMVSEHQFADNVSQWVTFKKDKGAYKAWVAAKSATAVPIGERSNGYRYKGQYKEQIPAALEVASKS